ncbi:hypothetical protein Nmel_002253 [Mimus melanotis]
MWTEQQRPCVKDLWDHCIAFQSQDDKLRSVVLVQLYTCLCTVWEFSWSLHIGNLQKLHLSQNSSFWFISVALSLTCLL